MQRGISWTLTAAEYDEAGLLERARRGDTDAFESLYRRHAPSVYGLCLRLAGSAAEAQDCTQDTFVRAWHALPDFRGQSRISTWLHRIAVNEVLGRKRRRAMEHRHLAAVEAGKRYTADDPATVQDLERAIKELPDRAREIFVLHAIYGYTHEEIASMLSVTVATSKSQTHRARKLLVAALPGVRDADADRGAGGGPDIMPSEEIFE